MTHTEPEGWTSEGMKRGWVQPKRTRADKHVNALKAENAKLKGSIEDLVRRIEQLECANEAKGGKSRQKTIKE